MRHSVKNKIIGTSKAILDAIEIAVKVAPYSTPVLIVGETGTGKELFANLIHEQSPWSSGPFIPVNCAALTESLADSMLFGHRDGAFTGAREQKGLIAEAHNGTLFLDEVGEMPEAIQCKLLRVAQDGVVRPIGGSPRQVNFRIVAATNADIKAKMRQDLLFRFGARLSIPPLRDRVEDIEPIIRHVVKEMGASPSWDIDTALPVLQAMPWVGNVRQLINEVKYSIMTGHSIPGQPVSDLPADSYPCHLPSSIKAYEARLISGALARTRGNVAAAARLLGLNRTCLAEKISAINRAGASIDVDSYRLIDLS